MPEPETAKGLLSSLQERFSNALRQYNEVDRLARHIEQGAQRRRDQGVVAAGLQQMIVNRYHGVVNMRGLIAKAGEGAAWSYYFATSPALSDDVNKALLAWARSKLTMANITVEGLAKAGVTTVFGEREIGRVSSASQELVQQQLTAMGVSVVTSAAISSLLKRVGNTAQTQIVRDMARKARVGWRITGLAGILFGLGKIADTMHDTGAFAEHLRRSRDAYNEAHAAEIRTVMQRFQEAYGQTASRPA